MRAIDRASEGMPTCETMCSRNVSHIPTKKCWRRSSTKPTYAVHHSTREPDVVQHQIQQLMELYDQGIVNANNIARLTQSFVGQMCFNKDPSTITRGTATPVSQYVNCGMLYGHELVFSHTLPSQNPAWENTPFTLRWPKSHTLGATEIYKHGDVLG
jgi:hypothetical protein